MSQAVDLLPEPVVSHGHVILKTNAFKNLLLLFIKNVALSNKPP